MAETETGTSPEAAAQTLAGLTLAVNAQYVKDLSFENPRAPASLMAGKEQPQIDVNVNVNARGLQPNVYEVSLSIRADAKIAGEAAFITELDYGGVFTVANAPEEVLRPVLLIECPRILFPFARRIIADVTRDGGFPPLFLNPIDFVSLYRRQFMLQESPAAGQA